MDKTVPGKSVDIKVMQRGMMRILSGTHNYRHSYW